MSFSLSLCLTLLTTYLEFSSLNSYRILQINKGEIVYASYSVQRQTTIFQTKEELAQYSKAALLEHEFSYCMENKRFDAALCIYNIAREQVDSVMPLLNLSEQSSV